MKRKNDLHDHIGTGVIYSDMNYARIYPKCVLCYCLSLMMVVTIGMFLTSDAFANPIPSKKPLTSNQKTQNFDKLVLETASKETVSSPIPIPAPTPDIKRPTTAKSVSGPDGFKLVGGMPIPPKKPFFIAKPALWTQQAKTEVPSKNHTYYYNGDERMAGEKHNNISPRSSIDETNAKSPFKTAKLPRAARYNNGEPVIIFFEEKEAKLEVGQKEILQSDVINTLKRTNSKRIALYGYAEEQDKDKIHQLSMQRALLIGDYINSKGIASDRIEARAMGNDTPISPKNRVDIIIY